VAKLAALLGDNPRAAIDRTFRPMVSRLLVATLSEHELRRLRLVREMLDTQPQLADFPSN
jgi:hypothetical protein